MFGINLTENGLYLTPFVPEKFGGDKRLTNFKYRNAIIDITVHGTGSNIIYALVDDKKVENISIPKNISGKHTIEDFFIIKVSVVKSILLKIGLHHRHLLLI